MDTVNDNNIIEKIKFPIGTSLRVNKLIYFCLNLVLILPLIIDNFSPIGAGISATIIVIALLGVVIRNDIYVSAGAYLTSYMFFDLCIYLGLNFESLKNSFSIDDLEDVSETFGTSGCLHLALFGIVVAFVGMIARRLTWLTGVGGGAIGVSIILSVWSNCDFKNFLMLKGGGVVLVTFLVAVLCWTVSLELAVRIAPHKKAVNVWMGILVLAILIVLWTTETSFVNSIVESLDGNMSGSFVTWWKVILACIVLLVCSVAMFDAEHKEYQMGDDSFVTAAIAVWIFALKVLTEVDFIYGFALFVALVASTMKCLSNEIDNQSTCRLKTHYYLIAELIAFLISLWMLNAGYWINVVVTLVFAIMFYAQYERMKMPEHKNLLWISLISLFICEAVAWQMKMHFSVYGIIILACVFLVAVATVLVVNRSHPDEIIPDKHYKIAICFCVALLCVISMQTTVKVNAEVAESNNSIQLNIEAKEDDITIENIEYKWQDILGRQIDESVSTKDMHQKLDVKGNILTVKVTDSDGYVATYYYWFPILKK